MDNDNKNALILALMVLLKVIKKYLGLFILLFIFVFLLLIPNILNFLMLFCLKNFNTDMNFGFAFNHFYFLRSTWWFAYSFSIPIVYCLKNKLFKKIPFYLSILKPFYYFSLGISSVIVGVSLYYTYYATVFVIPILYGILSIIIGFVRKKNVGKI